MHQYRTPPGATGQALLQRFATVVDTVEAVVQHAQLQQHAQDQEGGRDRQADDVADVAEQGIHDGNSLRLLIGCAGLQNTQWQVRLHESIGVRIVDVIEALVDLPESGQHFRVEMFRCRPPVAAEDDLARAFMRERRFIWA